MIETRIIERYSRGLSCLSLTEGGLSPRQEVEGRRQMDCGMGKETKRQETLLAVTGQVGDPLYSSTREAVLTLKCPIRGIDMSQSIRWICATSVMEEER
jgi:hypothetical protein